MELETALVALVGIAGILGTLRSAQIAAQANREAAALTSEEARRARAEEALRPLVAQLLRAAEEHASQVSSQVAWRSDPNATVLDPAGAPRIDSTEPMYLLMAEFHVLVGALGTASAAFALYGEAVALDRWAYRPELHLQHGQVIGIGRVERRDFDRQTATYMDARRDFINAARTEFGRTPFGDDEGEITG